MQRVTSILSGSALQLAESNLSTVYFIWLENQNNNINNINNINSSTVYFTCADNQNNNNKTTWVGFVPPKHHTVEPAIHIHIGKFNLLHVYFWPWHCISLCRRNSMLPWGHQTALLCPPMPQFVQIWDSSYFHFQNGVCYFSNASINTWPLHAVEVGKEVLS